MKIFIYQGTDYEPDAHFRRGGVQVHVAHLQRLPYCTIGALGTAVARKATHSTRSTLRTLGLNAPLLTSTAVLSPPAFESPNCCCSAGPLRLYPPSSLRRAALANLRTHRRAVFGALSGSAYAFVTRGVFFRTKHPYWPSYKYPGNMSYPSPCSEIHFEAKNMQDVFES